MLYLKMQVEEVQTVNWRIKKDQNEIEIGTIYIEK